MDFEMIMVLCLVFGLLGMVGLVMILDARITRIESRLRNKYIDSSGRPW